MATDSTGAGGVPGPASGTILVVEDDERTSRLERFVLEEEGYAVECAGTGEEALAMLPGTSPSLVLLDIMLPDMDGFMTCQKIRESSQVPIIMVTAEGRDEDKVRGLEMGADDYITKPFSTNELAARVKAVLRRLNAGRSKALLARPETSGADTSFLDGLDDPDGTAEVPAEQTPANHRQTSQARRSSGKDAGGETEAGAGPNDEDFEGAVKLVVETTGAIKNMVNFVDALRENPKFHLLRMVSNARRDGMDVWIRLREPNPLRTTLLAANGVSKVEVVERPERDPDTGAETRVLKVSLD